MEASRPGSNAPCPVWWSPQLGKRSAIPFQSLKEID
jgi:hypothetical protein